MADVVFPVVPRFADHARNQVDVHVGEFRFGDPLPGAKDLLGQVSATVFFENFVAEVFDAEADPGDTQFFTQSLDLGFAQCSWLAFERDLFGAVPSDMLAQPSRKFGQLFRRQETRGTTTEVDKTKRAILHDGQFADHRDFVAKRIDVPLDFRRLDVGENFEVTELAAFPAEWNVQIQSQWGRRRRRAVERSPDIIQVVLLPLAVRRIVRDEVAAYFGFLITGGGRHRLSDAGGQEWTLTLGLPARSRGVCKQSAPL